MALPPPSRSRASNHLTQAQREEISRGLVEGYRQGSWLAGWASRLRRSVGGCSQWRAVRPTAPPRQKPRHGPGQDAPKMSVVLQPPLRDAVASELMEDWSPQQIAGWLHETYENEPAMQVSHETIYRTLHPGPRGAEEGADRVSAQPEADPPNAKLAPTAAARLPMPSPSASAQQKRRTAPSWTLGRRSDRRGGQQLRGHAGGAALAIRRAGASHGQGLGDGRTSLSIGGHAARTTGWPLTWDRGTELAQHKRFTVETNIPRVLL